MRTSASLRRVGSLLAAVAIGVLGTQAFAAQDESTHLPADKTAVAGGVTEEMGANEEREILSERMRVSTTEDLILGLTAECSILTGLVTNSDNNSSSATGQVEMRITIDGQEVPIQTGVEDGQVVFCNRTYSRTVTDDEDPLDGIDQEDDYIRTRSANAFNWVAFNVGDAYDTAANGDNIVEVKVFAKYTTATTGDATAEAIVGKRTLVIEPVKAANTEVSEPADPAPAEDESPLGIL